MVQADHPSYRSYLKDGCRCAGCREENAEYSRWYRQQRRLNGGLVLTESKRKMPSLMHRLRREIGIIVPWRP